MAPVLRNFRANQDRWNKEDAERKKKKQERKALKRQKREQELREKMQEAVRVREQLAQSAAKLRKCEEVLKQWEGIESRNRQLLIGDREEQPKLLSREPSLPSAEAILSGLEKGATLKELKELKDEGRKMSEHVLELAEQVM